MKIKLLLVNALIYLSIAVNAQLQVRADGSIQTGYNGYANLWLGSFPSQGVDNGQWGIEIWDGNFNIWKPWPSPNSGNYFLFIRGDNGNVGIGKNPSYKLDVDGDIATYGTLRISSDPRLKTNIRPLSDCLNSISLLNGKSYCKTTPDALMKDSVKRKTVSGSLQNNELKNSSVQFGLLADEVKGVLPELVSTDASGYMTVDYIGLIPVIIEALKEQKALIDNQKEQIRILQQQVSVMATVSNSSIAVNVQSTVRSKP